MAHHLSFDILTDLEQALAERCRVLNGVSGEVVHHYRVPGEGGRQGSPRQGRTLVYGPGPRGPEKPDHSPLVGPRRASTGDRPQALPVNLPPLQDIASVLPCVSAEADSTSLLYQCDSVRPRLAVYSILVRDLDAPKPI